MLSPGIHHDVPEAVYHADPCEVPSLSPSIAKKMVNDGCAAEAYRLHPRLGGHAFNPTESKRAQMDLGTLCHDRLLGSGPSFVVLDFDSWRTKASKEARDEVRSRGEIPVLQHDYEGVLDIVERVKPKLLKRGYELDGRSEVTLIWKTRVGIGEITCRTRIDHWRGQDWLDLKFTGNASPRFCEQMIRKFGYHIQWAAHEEAFYSNGIDASRMPFTILNIENSPGAYVTPTRLSESMKELGRNEWDRAKQMWYAGMEKNEWPEYVADDAVHTVVAKPWELKGDNYDDE